MEYMQRGNDAIYIPLLVLLWNLQGNAVHSYDAAVEYARGNAVYSYATMENMQGNAIYSYYAAVEYARGNAIYSLLWNIYARGNAIGFIMPL
jgi:hypothetical protein